ncbi:acyltransferase [Flaviaesturariibacter amylovorans]|uniref:Acyltransferase n=1 Tax=Flaviaesturariibacter amylovorans TaxID=1084520 RepID=A0ABP8GGB8_9BACT
MQTMLRPEWSRKMRFFSFVSMLLLVYVHGYDLNDRYLQPFGLVQERTTFTTFFEYLTANGLFRFRIPMLFAISGYLLARGDEKGYLRIIGKRFRTIAIPYFLWSAIGILIVFALLQWSFTRDVVATQLPPDKRSLGDVTANDWFQIMTGGGISYQLWFIRSLFILNLLYPVLRLGVLKAPKVLFPVLTLLWLATPMSLFDTLPQQFQGPWRMLIDGEGLLPFCLGIWLCKRGKDLSRQPRWFSMKGAVAVLLVLSIAKTWIALNAGIFPGEAIPRITIWVMHKFVVASGLLVAWYGADRLSAWAMSKRWFRAASDQSFMIYALHVPLVTYLIDPVHGLLQPFRYYRLATYLLLPAVLILFCMAVGALLKKVAPPVFGILTGNRGLTPLPEPPAATSEEGSVRVLPVDAPAVR